MTPARKRAMRVLIAVMVLLILLAMFGCGFTDGVIERSQENADAANTYAAWGKTWQASQGNDRPEPTATSAK